MSDKSLSTRSVSARPLPNVSAPVEIQNQLLKEFPEGDLAALRPHMTTKEYEIGHVLLQTGERAREVFFPDHGAVVSLISDLVDGGSVEVGIVGDEGCSPVEVALGASVNSQRVIVQGPGRFVSVPVSVLRRQIQSSPALLGVFALYAARLLVTTSQTAACNRAHSVEERLSRWLLIFSDRVHTSELLLTQEFLSHMLGVRRAGVNVAVGTLKSAGVLLMKRGRIVIVDRDLLISCSCECYMQERELLGAGFEA